MASKQGRLPLQKVTPTTNPGLRKALLNVMKALRKATTQLEKLKRATGMDETLLGLDRTISALRAIGLEVAIQEFDAERAALDQRRDEALKCRREQLVRSATDAGWKVRRLKHYDFVGCFQVKYRNQKVTLRIGSEILETFNEVDGASVFSRLQAELESLETSRFSRTEFLNSIKAAISLARVQGVDRNGKVPIRRLYPLVVLVRQSHDRRFLKRPDVKSFTDYTMAQFAYDLARFGLKGWRTEHGERLCNQPPNMGSIAKGASVTLPSLTGDGSGRAQIGSVWVQTG